MERRTDQVERYYLSVAHARVYDGETIYIEPWRAEGIPDCKDLVVDRSAFDRVIQAADMFLLTLLETRKTQCIASAKVDADKAFDAATVLVVAPVATCKNSSAMLFVSAKGISIGIVTTRSS